MYSQAIKVALALRLDHLNDEQNEAMTSGTGDGQTATYVIVHVCTWRGGCISWFKRGGSYVR